MKPKAIFITGAWEDIYGPEELADINEMCEMVAPPQTAGGILEHLELLREVEIIFSGWGAPLLDKAFLDAAPKLKAVFYGAGSIRGMVTDEMWDRGIIVTSSWAANAVPVSEFTLSEILFSLKSGWRTMYAAKFNRAYPEKNPRMAGAYRSTVGIISLGMIGRMVVKLLKNFDVKVIAYDPFATQEQARELGVELRTLDQVFQEADVVSLHTPWLPETVKMIQGRHFRLMKDAATFINTARGAVVDEEAMLDVMEERGDLTAVLDVTWPEPPAKDSRIFSLPNVFLTPHIAGSLANECHRMGRYAVEECRKYIEGKPLAWQVTRRMAEKMA